MYKDRPVMMFISINVEASILPSSPLEGFPCRVIMMIFLDQTFQQYYCRSSFSFRSTILLPVISTLLAIATTSQVISALNINFGPDSPPSDGQNFVFFGDSNLNSRGAENSSRISALQITTDSFRDPMENQSGRAMYRETFKLRRNFIVSSFRTTFELMIKNVNNESAAEGMAFILSNSPELPADSEGQWLGITNKEANGSSSSKVVAIEFDTHKSYDGDLDDNHVSVNVRGMVPLIQVSLSEYNVNLSSVSNKFVDIRYNGTGKQLTVYVHEMNDDRNRNIKKPVVSSLHVDISEYLDEDVYVGFSGSTGTLVQLNYVMSWNFTTGEEDTGQNRRLLWIFLGCTLLPVLFIGGGCGLWYWRRKWIRDQLKRRGRPSPELQLVLEQSTRGPREFRLRELRSATMNFSPKNKLGRGGFGTVYKGYLKETREIVAVKRVSEESRQGQQEFVAEVTTIGRLSHKNLVKLIGWCYERRELLLVYEFIPYGSLDKLLYKYGRSEENDNAEKMIELNWKKRIEIIRGVASALCYLHEGCHRRILHRDVKASNVMIDSDYNARLGDFGLARTVEHGGNHHLTDVIAGTPGFIAPEFGMTGRATAETDVYGFGVFLLEVACGRKPKSRRGVFDNDLLNWVWHLHQQHKVVDAADIRLHAEYDQEFIINKEEIECVLGLGLCCCDPDPEKRPSMRLIEQILSGEAAPLRPPPEKPSFTWPLHETYSDSDGGPLSSDQDAVLQLDEEEITEFRSAAEITVVDQDCSNIS